MSKGLYIQYGCGLSAPKDWVNFDVSPTLRLQKIFGIAPFLKKKLNTQFPANVKYGDIIHGLPGISEASCDGIYCSHVLEHLSLADFYKALSNTYLLLKPNGIFRCVLPDLEYYARMYLENLSDKKEQASHIFIKDIHMGADKRTKTFKDFIVSYWGNSKHQWMWDNYSLEAALHEIGFRSVRRCTFNDSHDKMFLQVESAGRFRNSLAFEAVK